MKKLFLASQFYVVAESIGVKIPKKSKQKTVFITTPIKYRVFTESELDWHYKNRATLQAAGFIYDDYDITDKTEIDLKKDLDHYEVMYMEGGNPFYLLQASQKNNFTQYVTDRVRNGLTYVSESAGSVAAGIDISANSRPGKSLQNYDLPNSSGFGFVNFAILPHWGQESKKPDYFAHKISQSYDEHFPYVFLTNNQYIEVTDNWYKIVDVAQE